ncbi:MAG: hypothetical protein DHS80DRAFT_24050 [Piptocephalis tieghemiana]|nr:MAG: hypothetical protein DHS80DRAFT_24050 [Piptocephalis tieghemiana]
MRPSSRPVSRSSSSSSLRALHLPLNVTTPGPPLPTVTTPVPVHGDHGRIGYNSAVSNLASATVAPSPPSSGAPRRSHTTFSSAGGSGGHTPNSHFRSFRASSSSSSSTSSSSSSPSLAAASLTGSFHGSSGSGLAHDPIDRPRRRGQVSRFANSPTVLAHGPVVVRVGESVQTTRPATSETAWSRAHTPSSSSGSGPKRGSVSGGGDKEVPPPSSMVTTPPTSSPQTLSRTQQELLLQRAMVQAYTDPESAHGIHAQYQQPLGRGAVWIARELERTKAELIELRRTNAIDPLWDGFRTVLTHTRMHSPKSSAPENGTFRG